MSIIYESTTLALLGFAAAVLLVCSFIYLTVFMKKISGDIRIPIGIAEQNRPFFVQVQVRGPHRMFCSKIRASVCFGKSLDKKKKRMRITLERAKNGQLEKRCRVTISEPGDYVFSLGKIRVYDITGLFYLTKKGMGEEHALVLPEPSAIPVVMGERVRNFFGDADTYDALRPGYDPSETFEVRPFRNGDRLQSVHWKLSAKSDELMVKESSLPKACPVVFFLTPCREKWNRQLGMITSVSYSLMDASCPHFVVWISASKKELIRTRVDDEESYYLFLTTFMQDADFSGNRNPVEEYHRTYGGESCLYELTMDSSGALALNQTPVISNEKDQVKLLLK